MPAFIGELQSLTERLRPAKSGDVVEVSNDDLVFLRERIFEIRKACETLDVTAVKTAMADLKRKTWPNELNDTINEIYLNLVRGEVKKVVSGVEKIENLLYSRPA